MSINTGCTAGDNNNNNNAIFCDIKLMVKPLTRGRCVFQDPSMDGQ